MRNRHESFRFLHGRLLPLAFFGMAAACFWLLSFEALAADVKYLHTTVSRAGEAFLVGRGAFAITGPPHRWYSVYFDVRQDAAPVRDPAAPDKDRHLLIYWGDIFTPENIETARYTDCRIGIPLEDLARLKILSKGKRTTLWVVCGIWDTEKKEFLGSGWGVRSPLIVTTDGAGNIVKTEVFNTEPLTPKKSQPAAEIQVKECLLPLKHLKMKPGAGLYRAVGIKQEPYNILVKDGMQAELETLDRGFFFEAIDSAEKARELVEIGYPGAVVIETPAQYAASVQALKGKGWLPGKHLKNEKPPSYGVGVKPEPELGYRVSALMIDSVNYYGLGLRSLFYREFAVAPDGRLGMDKEIELVQSPQSQAGAAPGWSQPVPLEPKPYNDLLRALLTPEGSRVIPKVAVTEKKTSIKCAEGEKPEWYLGDYKDWPKHADE